jgi:hypothetical protein
MDADDTVPALRCIAEIADGITAGDCPGQLEDRRYAASPEGGPPLRTLSVVCGDGRAVVLNGDASRTAHVSLTVRLAAPALALYGFWTVPATELASGSIVRAVCAFCKQSTANPTRQTAETGLETAARILGGVRSSQRLV